MADDEVDEEEEEEGGGKKKIIMIVGGLAALGGVYNFVLKPAPEVPPDELAATEPVEEEEVVEPNMVPGEILELDEMILNIGGLDDPAFLRIGIALVLNELTVAADFEAEAAIAKDVAVQYLSSLTKAQLSSPEGRALAKEELTTLIQEAYLEDNEDQKVVRVLFTAVVMQ